MPVQERERIRNVWLSWHSTPTVPSVSVWAVLSLWVSLQAEGYYKMQFWSHWLDENSCATQRAALQPADCSYTCVSMSSGMLSVFPETALVPVDQLLSITMTGKNSGL